MSTKQTTNQLSFHGLLNKLLWPYSPQWIKAHVELALYWVPMWIDTLDIHALETQLPVILKHRWFNQKDYELFDSLIATLLSHLMYSQITKNEIYNILKLNKNKLEFGLSGGWKTLYQKILGLARNWILNWNESISSKDLKILRTALYNHAKDKSWISWNPIKDKQTALLDLFIRKPTTI